MVDPEGLSIEDTVNSRPALYAIWLHWLQQQIVERTFDFEYCPTQFQLADAFTKNLAAGSEPGHFHFFRDQLVQKLS